MISILFNGLISVHARVNVLYIIELISLNSSKTLYGISLLELELVSVLESNFELISFFKIDFFVKLKNEIIVESLFELFNFILLSIISIEIIR